MLAGTIVLFLQAPGREPGSTLLSTALACLAEACLVACCVGIARRARSWVARTLALAPAIYCGYLLLLIVAADAARANPGAPLPLLALAALVCAVLAEARRTMGRRGRVAAGLGVLTVVAAMASASAAGIIGDRKDREARHACIANFHALYSAFDQYAREHEGLLPDAGRWARELYPYLDDWSFFWSCPPFRPSGSGYTMNPSLSGKRLDEVRDPARTVLLREVPHAKPRRPLLGHAVRAQRSNWGIALMADGTVRAVDADGTVP
jgi:hypothetical protein